MSWTEERIDRLKKMWQDGATASQIADELGGVSRNAVIGKAHRLGLEARPSPVKPGEEKEWPVAFVIDPKLPRDVTTITLSYTFFEVGGKTPPAPQAQAPKDEPRS